MSSTRNRSDEIDKLFLDYDILGRKGVLKDRLIGLATNYPRLTNEQKDKLKSDAAAEWQRFKDANKKPVFLNNIPYNDLTEFQSKLQSLDVTAEIINYLILYASQNGYLTRSSDTAYEYNAIYQDKQISCADKTYRFVVNPDKSISFTETFLIHGFRNKTPAESNAEPEPYTRTKDGSPFARVVTTSTISLTDGKIKHELASDKVILFDARGKALFDSRRDEIIDQTPTIKKRVAQGVVAGIAAALVIAGAALLIVGTGGIAAAPITAAIGLVAAKVGFGVAVASVFGGFAVAAVAAGAAIGAFFGGLFGLVEKKKQSTKKAVPNTSSHQYEPDIRDERAPVSSTAAVHTVLAQNQSPADAITSNNAEPQPQPPVLFQDRLEVAIKSEEELAQWNRFTQELPKLLITEQIQAIVTLIDALPDALKTPDVIADELAKCHEATFDKEEYTHIKRNSELLLQKLHWDDGEQLAFTDRVDRLELESAQKPPQRPGN